MFGEGMVNDLRTSDVGNLRNRFMLIGVMLVLAACAVPAEKVPGRYVCVYLYGLELLLLRQNGTYVQVIDVNGRSGPAIHQGKRRYDSERGEVSIESPLLVDDGFGKPVARLVAASGLWVLPVDSRLGSVRMRFHPDFDERG